MNIANRLFSLLLLLSFSLINQANAQSNIIQDYILYKGYPYFVSMTTDGEILEFIRTAPEIMKGKLAKDAEPPMALGPYVKPQVEIAYYVSPLNTTKVGDVETLDSGNNNSQDAEEVQVQAQQRSSEDREFKTTIIRKETETSKDPVITRKETSAEESDAYSLKFQGFSARLTPYLINQLEDISKEHVLKPNKYISIRSFLTAGDDTNKKLAINRMNACKDLLITYGVPAEMISTGIRPYRNAATGNVTIEFVDELDND